MTPAGAVVGTPAYMAPEQIRGDADVSPAIDQYSLGVLMYELMTGRIPFEGSLRTVLSRTLNDAPEDPMRIRQGSDPGLSQICLKLLAKRSVDRFPSMSELATALDQWEPDTQLQSDRSRGSSNRFRAIAASVILGMAIIGVNLLIRNSQSTERARLRLDLDPSLVDKTVTLDGRPLIFGDSRSPFNISSGDHEIVFKQGAATVLAHKFRVDANETTVLALCLDRSRQVDAALTTSNGAQKLDASTAIASVAPQALKVAPLDISPAASKASKSAPVGRSATEIRQAAESKPRWQSWPPESPRPAVAPFSAEQAARLQSEWAAFLKKPVSFQNSLGMTFRLIPPGEYDMGSSDEEVAESLRIHHPDFHEYLLSQKPRHLVVITQPFYVGACEVTQKDYLTIMGSNPSYFSNEGEGRQSVAGRETSNHPVDSVSWNDCIDFCNALSVREQRKPSYSRDGDTVKRLDGAGYTLPSEAEWEYVCRAGTTTRHWIGNREEDLVQAAWFNTNSGGKSHPVGQLKANPFGLFDVHGSLWEWVDDEWQNNYYSLFAALPAVDPTGPAFEVRRKVLRGGVCLDPGDFCRSAFRLPGDQNIPHSRYGFRISILASSINNQ